MSHVSAGKNHFGLDPICSKYSRIHRCQTCLITSCTLCQRFLGLKGVVSTLSGTKSPPIWAIKKWFGVNSGSSLESSLTVVRGLELSRLSTPMEIVSNSSSFTSAPPSTAAITRLVNFVIDSKTLPACEFQFNVTPLLEVIHCTLSWSIAETNSFISLDKLTKFVPLSLNICLGQPLLAVIHMKALRNAPVSKDDANSKCQQCVCKQRNKHK